MNASDEALVAAAQAGDAAAMNELLGRHYGRVHQVCSRIAGSSRDADDAAQEAMIRVVRYLHRFDGRASFGTWVYRIATNAALDELRKRGRRPSLHVVGSGDADDGPPELADPTAEQTIDATADRTAIDAALAQLTPEFRAPLVMRDVAGLDYHEIADALGLPLGTVKSRIARARRQLVETLRHAGVLEGAAFGNQTPPSQRPTDDTPDAP